MVTLNQQHSKPLAGKALLKKVQELADSPRRDKARECGYYTITQTGEAKVELVEFYNALLEARDISLDPDHSRGREQSEPTYRLSVHKNGQIVIGSTYTKKMGLQPGDEFEIKLSDKYIHLKQLEQTEDEYLAVFPSDEVEKQVNLGREFMNDYHETFQELAK